ncbi:MAG TPA: twin-arginine translocase TatA/TatE family subunit [Chitinophagaceae bacterium]
MIQTNLLGVLGTQEIIIILVIVLLLFGGRKIPELMRGLGRGVREFNDAKNNVRQEIENNINDIKKEPNTTTPTPTPTTTTNTTPQP